MTLTFCIKDCSTTDVKMFYCDVMGDLSLYCCDSRTNEVETSHLGLYRLYTAEMGDIELNK